MSHDPVAPNEREPVAHTAIITSAAGQPIAAENQHLDNFLSGGETEYNYRLMALVRSRHPLIFVCTQEEDRFLQHLRHLTRASGYLAYNWDCVHGMRALNTDLSREMDEIKGSTDPVRTLKEIIAQVRKIRARRFKSVHGIIFVLCDFYRYLGTRSDPSIERLLRELAHECRGGSVIITGPRYSSIDGLNHVFKVLNFPKPNRQEIEAELTKIINSGSVQTEYPDISEYALTHANEIIDSVLGLTMAEIRAAFTQVIASAKEMGHHPLEIKKLIESKRSALKKNDSLEFINPKVTMEDIGGLDCLVDWVKDRKIAFSQEAQDFGIDQPKGLLLAGVPGMGKSLSAKGIAGYFNFPLLRLDLGAVMNSLVGESEANIREATDMAETLAPCVTGDAEVFDANGVSYSIHELMSNTALFNDKKFYTYSFNEETMKIEKTRVTAIIKKRGKRNLVEIVTANSQLRVTSDHKMMVVRDGKLEWLEAGLIKSNDFVVSPKKLKRDPINFDLSEALEEGFDISDRAITWKDGVEVSFCEKGFQIERCLYLVGMIDGAGYIEGGGVVAFHADGWNSGYAFSTAMQECFGIEPEMQSADKTVSCYVYNEIVYRIIDYARKNLTSFDDNLINSYLAGFVEAAARVQLGRNTKISFVVDEFEERTRLCKALHCVGIVAPRKTFRTVFVSSQHEIDLLAMGIAGRLHSSYLSRLIAHAVGDCTTHSKHVGYISDRMIPLEEARNLESVATLVDSEVVGVKVISVDTVEKDWVFDLSCEGNHNFFANNLLCHNCVLWVDEVEKALSAVVEKGSGDSGTSKRVISTFLTWLQEKTKPVFVICTLNNIEDIPPEFMRAGRFDEVFFIDLPDARGRADIIEIMLRKKGQESLLSEATSELSALGVACHRNFDQFSGAEIEKAVNEALFIAFKEKRQLVLQDLIEAAGKFKPLAKMRSEEIEKMRKWASKNARHANKTDEQL